MNDNPLSPREVEVLKAMVELSRTDLGDAARVGPKLGIRPSTVHVHTRAIRHKLGVSSMEQAVAIARERGWVE